MDLLLGVALAAQIESVDKYPTTIPFAELTYNGASVGGTYDATEDFSLYGAYAMTYSGATLRGILTYDNEDEDLMPSIQAGYALNDNIEFYSQSNLKDFDTDDVASNIHVGIRITGSLLQ